MPEPLETQIQSQLLGRLAAVRVYDQKEGRAPNKPLTLLKAIGDAVVGKPRLQPFSEYDVAVRQLLTEFGPPRRVVHPEYPFWYLQNDGVWEVRYDKTLVMRKDKGQPTLSALRSLDNKVRAGLNTDLFEVVRTDREFVRSAVRILLDASFPPSLHDEIGSAVGLDLAALALKRVRSPERISRRTGLGVPYAG